ncbi:MAG: imidazoleglycerol-phosphate dehydratase HisB [Oscillospiraceae bacterium]|nr:imidazoleglycerol-phosphate dehydratase HisB [Oscillospiraceae bacterium]MDY6208843.1 imidazoleglycerol-phosphate dehydratase HisB [Oscillospiraceae bacterium]
MRKAEISRNTKETKISVTLDIDGQGRHDIRTGIGFFDHMLTALCVHGGFDLDIRTDGDIFVDGHHSVEDTGIVLGQAFKAALGDMKGIARYGTSYIPMDESLGFCCLDISNRPFLVYECSFSDPRTGDYDNCLTEEFMRAFAFNAGITLHLKCPYGSNDHHKNEAMFKALAHALKDAVKINGGEILSTKGVL